MRGHVVRTFRRVPVMWIVLRRDSLEVVRQIFDNVRIRVLLNAERSRGVLNKQCQQTCLDAATPNPCRDLGSEVVEALAPGADSQPVRELLHSTVTLLARLRG